MRDKISNRPRSQGPREPESSGNLGTETESQGAQGKGIVTLEPGDQRQRHRSPMRVARIPESPG